MVKCYQCVKVQWFNYHQSNILRIFSLKMLSIMCIVMSIICCHWSYVCMFICEFVFVSDPLTAIPGRQPETTSRHNVPCMSFSLSNVMKLEMVWVFFMPHVTCHTCQSYHINTTFSVKHVRSKSIKKQHLKGTLGDSSTWALFFDLFVLKMLVRTINDWNRSSIELECCNRQLQNRHRYISVRILSM